VEAFKVKKTISKKAKEAPAYLPGDVIASDEVSGVIETCFWFKNQWNYVIKGNVAVDRDLEPPDPKRPDALRMGGAYIAQKNVKWWWISEEKKWQAE
jgi:hypothetical protein